MVGSNLNVVGLSVHIGSQIMSLNPFKKAFLKIKALIKKINKNEKIIKVLDLGGGIGINYKDEKIINFNSYAKIISLQPKFFLVLILTYNQDHLIYLKLFLHNY